MRWSFASYILHMSMGMPSFECRRSSSSHFIRIVPFQTTHSYARSSILNGKRRELIGMLIITYRRLSTLQLSLLKLLSLLGQRPMLVFSRRTCAHSAKWARFFVGRISHAQHSSVYRTLSNAD